MKLILIGPHGAGKTTLGELLAQRLGLPFHPELGRQLAEEPAWRSADATAADGQSAAAEAFDREIFARELRRDLAHQDRGRVVETWHPGNLAYAAHRSPIQAAAWLSALQQSCTRSIHSAVPQRPTWVLPLTAQRAALARRQSEAGDLDFFAEIGRRALRWSHALGLPCLPTLDTSIRCPEELCERVLRYLRSGPRPSPTPLGG